MIQDRLARRHRLQVYTLHSMLDKSHQVNVFNRPPEGVRKIVISTAISETSVTIDDVTRVIDTGFTKEAIYDDTIKATHLKRSWIAKANAIQRRGRAGRVKEGKVYRLYTKARFENLMSEYQIPEIKRNALESLILRMYYMNLDTSVKDILNNCLEPPEDERVEMTISRLSSMEALDMTKNNGNGAITPLGMLLNRFGVDPEIGRMLFYGCLFGLYDTVGATAAALSHKSPFTKVPNNKQEDAKKCKVQFDGGSDLVAMARGYQAWQDRGRSQDFAYDNFMMQDGLRGMDRSMEDFEKRIDSLRWTIFMRGT